MNVTCEISLGELFDKVSILRIKSQKIHDSEKLVHVRKEEEMLSQLLKSLRLLLVKQLKSYKKHSFHNLSLSLATVSFRFFVGKFPLKTFETLYL